MAVIKVTLFLTIAVIIGQSQSTTPPPPPFTLAQLQGCVSFFVSRPNIELQDVTWQIRESNGTNITSITSSADQTTFSTLNCSNIILALKNLGSANILRPLMLTLGANRSGCAESDGVRLNVDLNTVLEQFFSWAKNLTSARFCGIVHELVVPLFTENTNRFNGSDCNELLKTIARDLGRVVRVTEEVLYNFLCLSGNHAALSMKIMANASSLTVDDINSLGQKCPECVKNIKPTFVNNLIQNANDLKKFCLASVRFLYSTREMCWFLKVIKPECRNVFNDNSTETVNMIQELDSLRRSADYRVKMLVNESCTRNTNYCPTAAAYKYAVKFGAFSRSMLSSQCLTNTLIQQISQTLIANIRRFPEKDQKRLQSRLLQDVLTSIDTAQDICVALNNANKNTYVAIFKKLGGQAHRLSKDDLIKVSSCSLDFSIPLIRGVLENSLRALGNGSINSTSLVRWLIQVSCNEGINPRNILKVLDTQTAIDNVDACRMNDCKKGLGMLQSLLRILPNKTEPANVCKFRSAMKCAPPHYFRSIPPVKLGQAFRLCGSSFSKSMRNLLNITDIRNLTLPEKFGIIEKTVNLKKLFDSSGYNQTDIKTLRTALCSYELDCRKIKQLIKRGGDLDETEARCYFTNTNFKCIPRQFVAKFIKDNPQLLDSIDLSKAGQQQCLIIVKLFKDYGKPVEKWSAKEISAKSEIFKCIPLRLARILLQNLISGGEFPDFVEKLEPLEGTLPPAFIRNIEDGIMNYTNNNAGNITNEEVCKMFRPIASSPRVLKNLTDFLKQSSRANLLDDCNGFNPCLNTKNDLGEIYETSLKIKDKSTDQLTIDDKQTVFLSISGYNKSACNDLPDSILKSLVDDDGGSVLSKSNVECRKILFDRLRNNTNYSSISEEDLQKLGPGLGDLSDSNLAKIDKEKLCAVKSPLLDDTITTITCNDVRDISGLISKTDTRLVNDDGTKKIIKKVFTDCAEQSGNSRRRRRKRSTNSNTCSDMQALGDLVSTLDDTAFNMAKAEFEYCLEFFGHTVTSFTDAQLTLLAGYVKTHYGAADALGSDTIRDMGRIARGFSAEEISKLKMTDLEPVEAIGKYSGMSGDQLLKGVERYLTQQSKTAATLDESDLLTLGNFACGLETAKIAQVSVSAYIGAAEQIGALSSCTAAQLIEWAKLAKSNYGSDITQWDDATVSQVGSVIGGLTKTEMQTLSEDQINAIQPNTIKAMPATQLALFSDEQFKLLDSSQAGVISDEQKKALSSDQIATVDSKKKTVDEGSSATSVKVTVVGLVLTLLLHKLF